MNEANKQNTKRSLLIKIFVITIVLVALSLFLTYENNHLVITEYIYTDDEIPDEMNGFCLVQISDLHNAVFGKNNAKLIEKIAECNPDIIVITGDITDGVTHTNISKALNFAKQTVTICPVYYVTGNHEYYLNDDKRSQLVNGLIDLGVTVLDDSYVELFDGVRLIGLDDNSLSINFSPLTDPEAFNILLAHEPQKIKSYARNNADLVFSGHAHGGQFILPVIGAVYAPDQGLNPQYTEGLITEGNTDMIISRGLGNSVFPFRLFNYPEIVCVRFAN